jgi:hypothetical protein
MGGSLSMSLTSPPLLAFENSHKLDGIILYAIIRREPALDFQTSEPARLTDLRDPEVLALAARNSRVLVTHDQTTMPRHFVAFIATATSQQFPLMVSLSSTPPAAG